ncbi:MAG: hypothetical protein JKY65_31900 [Planctomycetes bacterium]|nr:hypothetical protein [Planctomycetota bacterium]
MIPDEGISFAVLVGGKRAIKGFTLKRGERKDGLQQVLCQTAKGGGVEIWVSTADATKGQVVKFVVGGRAKNRLSKAAGKALLGSLASKTKRNTGPGFPTPKAAVVGLIAACKASDLKRVGACFSTQAPGEFQGLIDGTCDPDKFKKLCKLFSAGRIGAAVVDPDRPNRAKVGVALGVRQESLTVIREGDTWRVLDF